MTMALINFEREKQPAEGGRQEIDEALRRAEEHSNHKAVEEVVCPDQEAE